MNFVTVGHQMPFDRLVRAVDDWAMRAGRNNILAQVGRSGYRPQAFGAVEFLEPREFQRCMREASAIVAHAGTGTVIAALEQGKPLLVLPRQAALGETRNDHHVTTARHFAENGSIRAALDDRGLAPMLESIEAFRPPRTCSVGASPELIRRIREFIRAR